MPNSTDTLFYVAFLAQIFLISAYFPAKIHGRMRAVLETYSPSEYPRLYPKPVEYYKIGHFVFKIVNMSILVLGLVILVLMLTVVDHATFADDGFISEGWPAAFGILQFIPFIVLEFTEFSQFRQMRKLNAKTTRRADLRPRRLLDFVSLRVLGFAVILFLATIFFDLYWHGFDFQWDHNPMQRATWLAITNVIMIAIGAWSLHGRKQDPHQTSCDREKQIRVNLNSMTYVSIAVSVFLLTQAANNVFDMRFLDALLMSLYLQTIMFVSIGYVMRNHRIEDIDFDVYRNDPVATS